MIRIFTVVIGVMGEKDCKDRGYASAQAGMDLKPYCIEQLPVRD